MSTIALKTLEDWNQEMEKRLKRYGQRRWFFNLWGDRYDALLATYEESQGKDKLTKLERLERYIANYDQTPGPLRLVRRLTVDGFIEQKRRVLLLSRLKQAHRKINTMVKALKEKQQAVLGEEDLNKIEDVVQDLKQNRSKLSYFSGLRNQLKNIIAAFNRIPRITVSVRASQVTSGQTIIEPEERSSTTDSFVPTDNSQKSEDKRTEWAIVVSDRPQTHDAAELRLVAASLLRMPQPEAVQLSVAEQVQKDMAQFRQMGKKVEQSLCCRVSKGLEQLQSVQQEEQQLKQIYKKLIAKYHPDQNHRICQSDGDKQLCLSATKDLIIERKGWLIEMKQQLKWLGESVAFYGELNKRKKERQEWDEKFNRRLEKFDEKLKSVQEMVEKYFARSDQSYKLMNEELQQVREGNQYTKQELEETRKEGQRTKQELEGKLKNTENTLNETNQKVEQLAQLVQQLLKNPQQVSQIIGIGSSKEEPSETDSSQINTPESLTSTQAPKISFFSSGLRLSTPIQEFCDESVERPGPVSTELPTLSN